MIKIKLIIIMFFILFNFSLADENCKARLPKIINNYSPVIVPLITFDGKYLYFDRKEHPENTGGIKDVDEIWYSERKMERFWSEPKKLESWLNTVQPDVIFTITPDGRKALVYGYYDSVYKNQGFTIVERNDNLFSNPKKLIIENYKNTSNNFYASISTDLNYLIISMKNEYSLGGEDLFVSFRNDSNDKWSTPKNLGSLINSNGDETSPVLAYDGKTLYFASNGHKGYGDFDLFMSRRLDNSWEKWSSPVNLGRNINTKFRETGFSISSYSDSAYIISSEFQLMKSSKPDDFYDTLELRHGIYSVCIPKHLQPAPYSIFKGRLFELSDSSKNLIKDEIRFEVNQSNSVHRNFKYSTKSDEGNYLFIIPFNTKAEVSLTVPGYENQTFQIRTDTLKYIQVIEKDFHLVKLRDTVKLPIQDYSLTLYFDFDGYDISDSQIEKIDFFLKDIDIEKIDSINISGHTDEIGTDGYNRKLSLKRAKNVAKILDRSSIEKKIIQLHAKGKSEQISSDANLNRRVEIKVKLKK